jgi:hypothetical protein
MDVAVVGEIARAAGLAERGYMLAAREEMQLQIRWRWNGDWRAGSVPDGERIVQANVGTIGHR